MSYASDRYKQRALFVGLASAVCIVGLVMVGFVRDVPTRYAGAFITLMGTTSNIPMIITWAGPSALMIELIQSGNCSRGQNARAINVAAVALGAPQRPPRP